MSACRRGKIEPYLFLCKNLNSKCIKYISLNPVTMNLIEEKVWNSLELINRGDNFLNIIPVALKSLNVYIYIYVWLHIHVYVIFILKLYITLCFILWFVGLLCYNRYLIKTNKIKNTLKLFWVLDTLKSAFPKCSKWNSFYQGLNTYNFEITSVSSVSIDCCMLL